MKTYLPIFIDKYVEGGAATHDQIYNTFYGENDYIYHNITSKITFDDIETFLCNNETGRTGMNLYSTTNSSDNSCNNYYKMDCNAFINE